MDEELPDEQVDTMKIAARLLDGTRSTLGIEAGIQFLCYLTYLVAQEPAKWMQVKSMVGDDSRPSAGLDKPQSTYDELASEMRHWAGSPNWPSLVSRLAEMLDEVDPVHHCHLFEALLALRSERLGRMGQESLSIDWLSELMVSLAEVEGRSVHDPACGLGGTLLAAARAGASSLSGSEINEQSLAIARMRLAVHGYQAQWFLQDSLAPEHHVTAERIITHPPIGMPLHPEQADRWGVKARDDAGAWLRVVQSSLEPDGRAVVLGMPARLSRSPILESLSCDGHVELLAFLPSGAMASTRVASVLTLFSKEPDSHSESLALNVAAVCDEQAGNPVLGKDGQQELNETLRIWRQGAQEASLPGYLGVAFEPGQAPAMLMHPGFEDVPEKQIDWPEPPVQLLRSLRANGVKSFAEPQSANLAPITLVFGPNSAGKSTLIQSLLLLLQSLRTTRLVTSGERADLGTFSALVSGHDVTRPLNLGLDFGIIPPWQTSSEVLHPELVRTVDVTYELESGAQAEATGVALSVTGCQPVRLERTDSGWSVAKDSLNDWVDFLDRPREAFFDPRTEAAPKDKRPLLRRGYRRLIEAQAAVIRAQGESLVPNRVEIPNIGSGTLDPNSVLAGRLGQVLRDIGADLQRLDTGLIHHGPIRPEPARVSRRQSDDRQQDFASFLFDNASALREVNEWLEQLGIPYEVSIRAVEIAGAPSLSGDLLAVVLLDTRSGVETSLADVGYGVSQVLPIVVDALRARDQVICMEQPELHLHPRLQANVADLLIKSTSAAGGANQVIAETHSEHILARLQRRVREGVIEPADVSVLYVEEAKDGHGASIIPLRLGPNGELLDPWPAGFFDDMIDDVLGGWL